MFRSLPSRRVIAIAILLAASGCHGASGGHPIFDNHSARVHESMPLPASGRRLTTDISTTGESADGAYTMRTLHVAGATIREALSYQTPSGTITQVEYATPYGRLTLVQSPKAGASAQVTKVERSMSRWREGRSCECILLFPSHVQAVLASHRDEPQYEVEPQRPIVLPDTYNPFPNAREGRTHILYVELRHRNKSVATKIWFGLAPDGSRKITFDDRAFRGDPLGLLASPC